MRQKSANQMPVSPANWGAIKANVSGIAEAAKEAQRTSVETAPPRFANIEILNQKANHADSMRILNENGLRPVTYQEILIILDKDPKLKEHLKGKRFWIDGVGTEMGGYHTLQSDGSLKKGRSEDPEKNVYCQSGSQPLLFYVGLVTDPASVDWRFLLAATDVSSSVAQVVVGVRIGHEVAARNTSS